MVDPQGVAAAQQALGAQLARLREATGYTQADLAGRVSTSRSTVANVETGHSRGTLDFWTRADRVLQARGALTQGYEEVRTLVTRQRQESARAAAAARSAAAGQATHRAVALAGAGTLADWSANPVGSVLAGRAPVAPGGGASYAEEQVLVAPAGRFFDGLSIQAGVYPAVDDGRVLTAVPVGYVNDQFLRRPRRGLVVGVADGRDGMAAFGLDSRQARRRLTRAGPGARLLIPHAYVLDDLTLGILWAVANLDEALLNDDGLLADLQQRLGRYEALPQSAAGRDLAADLTTVSQMWLGSDFCARHILRHLAEVSDAPAFWTREQRGEEASTWLLFAHKYHYLQAVTDRFGGTALSRGFCIPPETVAASSRPERILMLLAAALMESFAIRIEVCADPEYAAVEGFVLDPRRRAIVANWVGADGIWHVGVTADRPAIRGYDDITGHARAHSAIAGDSPAQRMRALAAYLELDWPWLARRCADLGEHGCAGLAEPRSRLLSTAGVDRACRYLSELDTAGG